MNDNLPLDSLMGEWFQNTGISLRDDMNMGCYYDYFVKSRFQAIPLVSDIRVLFANKTTFDQYSFPAPPPASTSFSRGIDGTWTWENMSDLVVKIYQNTGKPAFRFAAGFDEEFKLLASMMRSWGLRMFNMQAKTTYCGLSDPSFLNHFNNTIVKMFRAGSMFYCSSDDDPRPFRGCNETKITDRIFALEYSTIIDYQDIVQGALEGNSQVIEAYVPGTTTFLGGGGLIMTNLTQDPETTWRLMSYFFDTRKEYLTQIGLFSRSPPPYSSIANIYPWNQTTWTFAIDALKTAVPLQWPDETFVELGILDSTGYLPARQFMKNVLYYNKSLEASAADACKMFDEQNPVNIPIKFFQLDDVINIITFSPDPLPSPVVFECPYVVENSDAGAGIIVFSAMGMLASVFYSLGFYYFRDNTTIKASSPWFNQLTLLGSLLIYSSVITRTGDPKYRSCTLQVWLFVYGFGLFFGSIFVKLYRIHSIFQGSKNPSSKRFLKDIHLLAILGCIMMMETILMIAYTFVDAPVVTSFSRQVSMFGNVNIEECSSPNAVIVALLIVFNGLMIGYTCLIAIATRNAPAQYRENRFLTSIAYSSAFILIVIVPVYLSIDGLHTRVKTRFILFGLTADFMTLSCTSILSISKIYQAYIKDGTLSRSSKASRRSSERAERVEVVERMENPEGLIPPTVKMPTPAASRRESRPRTFAESLIYSLGGASKSGQETENASGSENKGQGIELVVPSKNFSTNSHLNTVDSTFEMPSTNLSLKPKTIAAAFFPGQFAEKRRLAAEREKIIKKKESDTLEPMPSLSPKIRNQTSVISGPVTPSRNTRKSLEEHNRISARLNMSSPHPTPDTPLPLSRNNSLGRQSYPSTVTLTNTSSPCNSQKAISHPSNSTTSLTQPTLALRNIESPQFYRDSESPQPMYLYSRTNTPTREVIYEGNELEVELGESPELDVFLREKKNLYMDRLDPLDEFGKSY
ncbi:hypothetical protein HK096_003162 [Nowakowskiella sp. JEL0078]|nr:hypothetical protein HK096_003162 [Nowakowskiella sp. JEL0078]